MGAAALFQIWGGLEPLAAADGIGKLPIKVWPIPRFTISETVVELALATVVGLIGGTITTLLAVAKHMGVGDFDRRFGWWYIARPVWGALLSGIAYFLLVAGLVTGVAEDGAIKPAGIAVVGGLTGLYSQLVLEKLMEIAKVLFSTKAADLKRLREEATTLAATIEGIRTNTNLTDEDKAALIESVLSGA